MRTVFCGTPEFAVPTLERLIAEPDFAVEAVVTQPDRPRGRGRETGSSAVKDAALAAGLYVYQPETIRSDSAHEFFKRLAPDAVVIVAYGQIIPARLLELPRLGWINLHASLLPKYRGAAPIPWAIMHGETRTGLTTMRIDAGLDTGPMLLQLGMDIGPEETTPEMAARMAGAGAPLVVESLRKLEGGDIVPVPQDHTQATFAPLLKKEHGRISWSHTAQQISDRIRGLAPWPGAFTEFRGSLCHIWGKPAMPPSAAPAAIAPGTILARGDQLQVACGQNSWLRVDEVQLEGRQRLAARDFANGARLREAERFS